MVLDPGIGFGKTLEHNLALLAGLPRLASARAPGAGRGLAQEHVRHAARPRRRGSPAGSLAAGLAAVAGGAAVLRVHDVRETVDALRVWDAVEAADDERGPAQRRASSAWSPSAATAFTPPSTSWASASSSTWSIDLSHAGAAATDDLADTVDYAALADAIAAIVEGPPFALLEHLARVIAGPRARGARRARRRGDRAQAPRRAAARRSARHGHRHPRAGVSAGTRALLARAGRQPRRSPRSDSRRALGLARPGGPPRGGERGLTRRRPATSPTSPPSSTPPPGSSRRSQPPSCSPRSSASSASWGGPAGVRFGPARSTATCCCGRGGAWRGDELEIPHPRLASADSRCCRCSTSTPVCGPFRNSAPGRPGPPGSLRAAGATLVRPLVRPGTVEP